MPPTTELEYEKLLELIALITDTVDDLEQNPYNALLDLAMHYMQAYRKTNMHLLWIQALLKMCSSFGWISTPPRKKI